MFQANETQSIKLPTQCLAAGCDRGTGSLQRYFCWDHWDELKDRLRDALVEAYESGQGADIDHCPSLEWWLAVQTAVAYLAYREERWSWKKAQEEVRKVRKLIARRDAQRSEVGPVS